MLLHIIKKDNENILSKPESSFISKSDQSKLFFTVLETINTLKAKIRMITTMMKMQKTLREENELIVKLKGFCPDNKIPRGLILEGKNALKSGKIIELMLNST
jgi:hypothetical protein